MPLEDREIFQAVWERFSDQPIEVVMEQYEKARRINLDIEKRMGTIQPNPDIETEVAETETVVEPVVQVQPKKRFTKRSLVVAPETAITDNSIICCLCGAERQSLTSKHLGAHGISVADYKKLCGYDPTQPLMSRQRHEDSRKNIINAQKARINKRKATREN